MESIKKTVRITITKEIEVELTPAVFMNMPIPEYLAGFSKTLWPVDSVDDIVKYAARMVAYYNSGMEHDGLGLVSHKYSTYPRVPDVKFKELSDECEEEILP